MQDDVDGGNGSLLVGAVGHFYFAQIGHFYFAATVNGTLSDGAGRRQIRIKALKVWPTAAGFPGPTRVYWGYAETRRVRSVLWGHGRKAREAWSVPVLSSTDSDNLQSPARTFDINFDIIGADPR